MMKKLFALLLASLMLLSCVACSSGSKSETQAPNEEKTAETEAAETETADTVVRTPQDIHVATGTSTGVGFITVSTVGSLLAKSYPEYTIVPEITTGGAENINMLLSGDAQLASCMLDDAIACNNMERKWEGNDAAKDSLYYVTNSYLTSITQFTPKSTGAKELSDLKGMRVGVASGTMANYYWKFLLEAYGMQESDFAKVEVMGIKDLLVAIQDGTLDYGVHVASTPNTSIQDTALSVGLNILTMSDEVINKMIELNPSFQKFTITKDKYDSDFDANTVGVHNVYVCTADADEQMIYDLVKTIDENNDTLKAAHPQAGEVGQKVMENQLLPFHPGAERYYKEIGLVK